jgi:hypothetical protein
MLLRLIRISVNSILNPDEAARLRNDRMELVTREDLRDLSRLISWRGPADLVELLRERVARPTNFDNLAQSQLGIQRTVSLTARGKTAFRVQLLTARDTPPPAAHARQQRRFYLGPQTPVGKLPAAKGVVFLSIDSTNRTN